MAFFRRIIRPFLSLLKTLLPIHPFALRSQGSWVVFAVLFPLLFLQGCNRTGDSESKTVITIGATHIHLDEAKRDFHELLSDLPQSAKNQESIKKQLLNQLVDRYLILEYGKEHHLSVPDAALAAAVNSIRSDFTEEGFQEAMLRDYIDFDQWKEQLRKRLLEKKIIDQVTAAMPLPDHATILHYYETHADAFTTKRQVKFRQIVTNDLRKAKNLLKRLRQGEDFDAVARERSLAPEAKNGGLVGWVEKGELEKTMDRALFSLKPGQVSAIIRSPYGYHIFQVLASRPAGVRPLLEVTREIEGEIVRARQHAFLAEWLKKQREHVKVQVDPKIFQLLEQ
ncbi:MAG: peptidylprolyl isomerase [Deltaproteobacteria bacterium]|nr:peptidylprolyl isomerase [Deltaproteobacteria bacterium]